MTIVKTPPIAASFKIPCVLMRGGTSRGPFFHEDDLPRDEGARTKFLIAAMGSPDALQVNGIGGGNPLTSKVAIVGAPSRPDVDVDYLFAQVSVNRPHVDFGPNCGNMLSAVGPFAIEAGLVDAQVGETRVRIFNRNTSAIVEAVVQTPFGVVNYEGDASIDGVPGTAAPIKLTFSDAVGSKTGTLLPSGHAREDIDGVPVTLVDYAMPMVLLRAGDVGVEGNEAPDVLDANAALLDRIERIRLEAGRRMGMGDVSGRVIPKVGLLSAPRNGGTITSRYFVPDRCHSSHSVTGALCVAVAARLPGSVAHEIAPAPAASLVQLEHPTGRIDIDLTVDDAGQVVQASLVRTARRIFEGSIIVPASSLI